MTKSANQNKDKPQTNSTQYSTSVKKPALTLDVDFYQSFLDDCDIPEDKKQELLETLWAIVIGFVDLGFGIHPLQNVKNEKSTQTDQALAEFIATLDQDDVSETSNSFKHATNPERING